MLEDGGVADMAWFDETLPSCELYIALCFPSYIPCVWALDVYSRALGPTGHEEEQPGAMHHQAPPCIVQPGATHNRAPRMSTGHSAQPGA